MSRWSHACSTLLSLLLDKVTGTKEQIAIRQDFCRIFDCTYSIRLQHRIHFTGSKAEGLDLPGSDKDYMMDLNGIYNIEVMQSPREESNSSANTLIMCTENVRPGFALLQMPRVPSNLAHATEIINGVHYLSSNLMVHFIFQGQTSGVFVNQFSKLKRQGPSIEQTVSKDSEGIDNVRSMHCAFWPNVASEWRQRPRYFGWPKPSDISSIVSFGCHLVAVGHPLSESKFTEWRISFSIAERTLVWSFNHVQMQCYAVMKIILKEFIKIKCSSENKVLCSYFIKTFLFWKFEGRDLQFWRIDNFRECIMYLLNQFVICLREGVLPHYFIPEFNLLSVKLTHEAQQELMQLFDIVVQTDITILKDCRTLQTIWSKLLSIDENQMRIIDNIKKRNFLNNDKFMAKTFSFLLSIIYGYTSDTIQNVAAKAFSSDSLFNVFSVFCTFGLQKSSLSVEPLISQILTLPCKTDLKVMIIKHLFLDKCIKSFIEPFSGNKNVYKLHKTANNELSSHDISTSKLWYAIVLLKKRDFTSALSIVNQVLYNIPPFAMYVSHKYSFSMPDTRWLYVDMFMNSCSSVEERAKQTWLIPLHFEKCMTDMLPLAIQIELYFCDFVTFVSIQPLLMTHYLAFQCHHELGQYDHRDNALRQLVDLVNNDAEKDNSPEQLFNIAGHCLLIAGDIARARDMFIRSKQTAFRFESIPFVSATACKFRSANWYLEHFC